jgi:two-component system response regulator RegX3
MANATSTILIMTTNDAVPPTLQKRMQEYGYEAIIARDEQTALDQSMRHLPAMILVERQHYDGRLPALIDTLWRNSALKQVPIVTFVDPQVSCCEEGCALDLDSGFNAYLCNMTFRQVVAYIRAILRTVQHSKAPREILDVDGIRMDLARHEVRVEGTLVELTPREFLIMKEFMRIPGQVLSRQELLNRVWGEDYAMEEHVLDVHIHALRQKIERDPSKPMLIVTIRGVGYKLQPSGNVHARIAPPMLAKETHLSKVAIKRSSRYDLKNGADELATRVLTCRKERMADRRLA